MNKSAKIISDLTNSSIVNLPGRKYPGLVIQGDSLSNIHSGLMTILEDTETKVEKETFLNILEQAEVIENHLLNYEKTLKDHSIDLPYFRDENRTTKNFQKYWDEN